MLPNRAAQTFLHGRGYNRGGGVLPQHLFNGLKLTCGLRFRGVLEIGFQFLLLLVLEFGAFWIHGGSGSFGKLDGEQFPGAMELASDGIAGLSREVGNLSVTEIFVRDEQQQEAILGG